MPLPPYIRRDKDADDRDEVDRERYQTVFARTPGAVAAPTAGLHFTEALLAQLDARASQRTFVTLHVGLGTFKPVTAESCGARDAPRVVHDRRRGGRRAQPREARGPADHRRRHDAARVLESQPAEPFRARRSAETAIFIYPPYAWRHVDALVTNFHLPRSTLIALVAAMVGLDEQRRMYGIAIEERYRFFSYGDAMFIE